MYLNNTKRATMQRNARCLLGLTAFILFFSTVLPVEAASYDCDASNTKIEKAICLNSNLSVLDEILSVAYNRALITSLNEGLLKENQRNWLIQRNNCLNEKCLDDLYTSRIEWLSKQPRSKMYYKLVRSKDDSICEPALYYFNIDLNHEYPLQPPVFIPTNYRIHVPAEVSPNWREGPSKGESWLTEVDLDWDGRVETVIKEWSLDRREKKHTGLDVMLDVDPKPAKSFSERLNHLKVTFQPETYFLEASYSSGTFNKPQYDETYSPKVGITAIEVEQFDVLIFKEKSYLTFVSNDIGEDFFEDWSKRKWRIISQYRAYENSKSAQDKRSLQDRLNDICYFLLIRNQSNEIKQ